MRARAERTAWVSYLRVSTHEQADCELSLPAQPHAAKAYARHHGTSIVQEYADAAAVETRADRRRGDLASRGRHDHRARHRPRGPGRHRAAGYAATDVVSFATSA